MPAGEIHVGDFGCQFQLSFLDQDSVIVDIGPATVKQVTFQRPDATTFTQNMGLLTDGTDGVATYTTVSGDITLPGIWSFQGYVIVPSGVYNTDITRFRVFENLYV